VRGDQPMLAAWAETGLVLADEFRDGNVPAHMEPLQVAQRAFAALPGTVGEYYYRGDSACHESRLVNWLRDEERPGGPRGRIGFAISARMSEGLRAALLAVPAEAWQTAGEDAEVFRECEEVAYVPSEKTEKKDQQPLRYARIRLRKRQGELLGDGTAGKHFVGVSNIWAWRAPRLLEWHRQKAGTMEMVHDILKNDVAAGVLRCGRFGANAAGVRFAVRAHNVMTALKRLPLPPELLWARPKRLRFLIFNTAGRLVHHARQTVLRLAARQECLAEWIEAMGLLWVPAPS
jgi:hypothetical protein